MNLIDRIKVSKVLAIENDVITTTHSGDAVNRETRGLIHTDEQIQNQQRNNHAVNHRRRNEVPWAVG